MAASGRLPAEIRKKVVGESCVDEDKIIAIIDNLLNRSTKLRDEDGGSQNKFVLNLEKGPNKKFVKPPMHVRKTLSYRQRRILGLYSICKSSLKYNDLLPLHSLWLDYMKKYIDFQELCDKDTNNFDESMQQIAIKLYRADYHGAELLVIRSTCPSYVGKSGIVAMETKNCFALVGKDDVTRKIPKSQCEFAFTIGQHRFTFFGKNFISRPADRSSKKIKTIYMPDL